MVKQPKGYTRFNSFQQLENQCKNVKFEGGKPDTKEHCKAYATLKLEALDEKSWKNLCRHVAVDCAHMLGKTVRKNERALYPLILGLSDAFLRLGSKAAQAPGVHMVDDEQQAAVGSNPHTPDESAQRDGHSSPKQAQIVPLQGYGQQQQEEDEEGEGEEQQQQQQQQQQEQNAPAAPSAKAVRVSFDGDTLSVGSLLSTRLAFEHDYSAAGCRGPIEFVYKTESGQVVLLIEAKHELSVAAFGKYMAQACLELIGVAILNGHTHGVKDEVFGWLTDVDEWVGISFKLDDAYEIPKKDCSLKDVHGTFKFTTVLKMMVDTGASGGYFFLNDFPPIMSEMARRLLPGCSHLHNISERLMAYQKSISEKAEFMLTNGNIRGMEALVEELSRKRARTEDAVGVLMPNEFAEYKAATNAVWELAEASSEQAAERYGTAASAVMALHKRMNTEFIAAVNLISSMAIMQAARIEGRSIDLATIRHVLTTLQNMVSGQLA